RLLPPPRPARPRPRPIPLPAPPERHQSRGPLPLHARLSSARIDGACSSASYTIVANHPRRRRSIQRDALQHILNRSLLLGGHDVPTTGAQDTHANIVATNEQIKNVAVETRFELVWKPARLDVHVHHLSDVRGRLRVGLHHRVGAPILKSMRRLVQCDRSVLDATHREEWKHHL